MTEHLLCARCYERQKQRFSPPLVEYTLLRETRSFCLRQERGALGDRPS